LWTTNWILEGPSYSDELHVAHATTVALLKLLLATTLRTDTEVICFSATTPEAMHARTNFPVQDILIPTLEKRQEFYDKHIKDKGLKILPSLSRAEKEIGNSVARWPSSRPLSSNVAVLKNLWLWKIRSCEWP
jgi:hypothetical protein